VNPSILSIILSIRLMDRMMDTAAICAHNVWIYNPVEEDSYKEFGLEEFIDHPPINFNESPFLFLLCLVDSIDPFKIFIGNYEEQFILDNFRIDFAARSIKIENEKFEKTHFDQLIKKCKDLASWLDVLVTESNGNINIELR
jgi:hypothetical protein